MLGAGGRFSRKRLRDEINIGYYFSMGCANNVSFPALAGRSPTLAGRLLTVAGTSQACVGKSPAIAGKSQACVGKSQASA